MTKILKKIFFLFIGCLFVSVVFICSREVSAGIDHQLVQNLKTSCFDLFLPENSKAVAAIFEDAAAAYPDDPLQRGIFVKEKFDALGAIRGDRVFPVDILPSRKVIFDTAQWSGSHVTYEKLDLRTSGNRIPNLKIYPYIGEHFNTMMSTGVKDLKKFDPKAPVRSLAVNGKTYQVRLPELQFHHGNQINLVLEHGYISAASSFGRMAPALRRFAEFKTEGSKGQHVGDDWLQVGAVAFDAPYHGSGLASKALGRYEIYESELIKLYDSVKNRGDPETPFGVMCRSGSCTFLPYINYKLSQLRGKNNPIKKMILMAPMHPKFGFVEAFSGYKKNIGIEQKVVNRAAYDWYLEIVKDLVSTRENWWDAADPLGSSQMLILFGEKDLEVPSEARVFFKDLAKKYPEHVTCLEIPNAGHDVFSVTKGSLGGEGEGEEELKVASAIAWKAVYKFLKRPTI